MYSLHYMTDAVINEPQVPITPLILIKYDSSDCWAVQCRYLMYLIPYIRYTYNTSVGLYDLQK